MMEHIFFGFVISGLILQFVFIVIFLVTFLSDKMGIVWKSNYFIRKTKLEEYYLDMNVFDKEDIFVS